MSVKTLIFSLAITQNFFAFLIAHHPGLRALWDKRRSSTHFQHKWVLFLKGISQNGPIYNYGAWMSLPDDLVVPTATCYYLFVNSFQSSFILLFATMPLQFFC